MDSATLQTLTEMTRSIEDLAHKIDILDMKINKMSSKISKEKYNKKEVCDILGISYMTLQHMIDQGKIATTKYKSREYITDEQLETYFESTRV